MENNKSDNGYCLPDSNIILIGAEGSVAGRTLEYLAVRIAVYPPFPCAAVAAELGLFCSGIAVSAALARHGIHVLFPSEIGIAEILLKPDIAGPAVEFNAF